MKIYRFLLFSFESLNEIVYITNNRISPYNDIKKYNEGKNTQLRWQRSLSEGWYCPSDQIVDELNETINDVQHKINRGDICIGTRAYDGDEFNDLRKFFIELIDQLFFSNYNECLDMEKKLYLNSHNLLKEIHENISKDFENRHNLARKHIETYFSDPSLHNQQALELMTGSDITLNINDENLMVNTKKIEKYFAGAKFELHIAQKEEYSTMENNALISDNEKIWKHHTNNLLNIEEHILKYLNLVLHRFPLKYYRDVNTFAVMFQDNAMNILEENLHNTFYTKYVEQMKNSSDNVHINVLPVEFLLYDMIGVLNHSIDHSVHSFFLKLNKVLNGDLKSFIGFFLYLFDREKMKNNMIIKSLRSDINTIGKNEILSNALELFLIEKNDIDISELKIKIFIKNNFKFNGDDKNLKSLEKKIYDNFQEKQLMESFCIIAYQILIRKVVNDYISFVLLLKKAAHKDQPFFKKVVNAFLLKNNDSNLILSKNKYDELLKEYMKVKEDSNFNFNNPSFNDKIKSTLSNIKIEINKFKILNKLLCSLNNEMIKIKDTSRLTPGEKERNKKAIIFYSYLIRELKDQWFY
ncbi:Plasmodium exported protein, unknown function [Plasmodium malariae]|uniref:Fam-f protein n=2 Tax=Plasmodium (Plasmodium) TaxID=418103 RepID=A0A1A8W8R2_PLAMA|nr:Plasmodium exported protein, unknown function [Plasmodium malariae]